MGLAASWQDIGLIVCRLWILADQEAEQPRPTSFLRCKITDGVPRRLRSGRVFATASRIGPLTTATSRTVCERPATGFPLVAGRFGVCGGCWVRTNVG
jgi:hypothetical protein